MIFNLFSSRLMNMFFSFIINLLLEEFNELTKSSLRRLMYLKTKNEYVYVNILYVKEYSSTNSGKPE